VRWLSRVVSVIVVLAVVAIAVLLIRSRVPSTTVGGRFLTYTEFRDGSRLQPGSPVVIAGVRIGDITGLSIYGGLARIDMRLQESIQIPDDSFATRKADSLFGDSYIEIIPGESTVMLKSGEPIAHVEEGGSTDNTLRTIARTMPRIDNGLEAVHEFTKTGRKVVAGPVTSRLEAADQWLAEGHIEGPLHRADDAMERVEQATTSAADAIASADVNGRLRRFDDGVAGATRQMRELRQALQTGFRDARAGFDRIDPVVDQMAEYTQAIDRGSGDDWRGTLGRLVNDDDLGETLEDASASGAEAVHGLNRFKSWLGATVEVSLASRDARVYATAELRARNDKFYYVEIVKSGAGGVPEDKLSDAAGTTPYTRTQLIRDEIRFTAQFGKTFGWLQLRGGLKESTFGMGADAIFFDNRLRLSADIFSAFSREVPRLKVAGAFAVFRNIYINAGIDDALNSPGYLQIRTGNTEVPTLFQEVHYGRDYFIGTSLHFDDADLATLLRVYGALLVAAIAG
jgi:phospholipid/cholesterol/gamma-HCH transport system substrate-binding protein